MNPYIPIIEATEAILQLLMYHFELGTSNYTRSSNFGTAHIDIGIVSSLPHATTEGSWLSLSPLVDTFPIMAAYQFGCSEFCHIESRSLPTTDAVPLWQVLIAIVGASMCIERGFSESIFCFDIIHTQRSLSIDYNILFSVDSTLIS